LKDDNSRLLRKNSKNQMLTTKSLYAFSDFVQESYVVSLSWPLISGVLMLQFCLADS